MSKKNTYSFSWIKYKDKEELPEVIQELLKEAKQAAVSAHAPYSRFCVGAALLTENNKIHTGNNQENIAFPSGLCAERVVLFYVSATHSEELITDLLVIGEGELIDEEGIFSPCGACRQVMIEKVKKQQKEFKVWMVQADGSIICVPKVSYLLPFGFGDDLNS